jgi:hypothetical protein
MAVVSRTAKIRFDNGLGSAREWVATAAVQDTAAGAAVVTTITTTAVGTGPPVPPDTLTLTYHNSAGAVIRTVALAVGAASQTDTFSFTATGLPAGAARSGTVEVALRATVTSSTPTNNYDYGTHAAPRTPPSTFTGTFDQGWVRGAAWVP